MAVDVLMGDDNRPYRRRQPPYLGFPTSSDTHHHTDTTLNPDLIGVRATEDVLRSYEIDVGFYHTLCSPKLTPLPNTISRSQDENQVANTKQRWLRLARQLTGASDKPTALDGFEAPLISSNHAASSGDGQRERFSSLSRIPIRASTRSLSPPSTQCSLPSHHAPTGLRPAPFIALEKDQDGFYVPPSIHPPRPSSSLLPSFLTRPHRQRQPSNPHPTVVDASTLPPPSRPRREIAVTRSNCSHSPASSLSCSPTNAGSTEDSGDSQTSLSLSSSVSSISSPCLVEFEEDDEGWIRPGVVETRKQCVSKARRTRELCLALARRNDPPSSPEKSHPKNGDDDDDDDDDDDEGWIEGPIQPSPNPPPRTSLQSLPRHLPKPPSLSSPTTRPFSTTSTTARYPTTLHFPTIDYQSLPNHLPYTTAAAAAYIQMQIQMQCLQLQLQARSRALRKNGASTSTISTSGRATHQPLAPLAASRPQPLQRRQQQQQRVVKSCVPGTATATAPVFRYLPAGVIGNYGYGGEGERLYTESGNITGASGMRHVLRC